MDDKGLYNGNIEGNILDIDVSYSEIDRIQEALQRLVENEMEYKVKQIERMYLKGKYSFDIVELISSKTTEKLKIIGENLGVKQTYKYKKQQLIDLVLEMYEEKIKNKILLFNENTFKILKKFIKNDSEIFLEKIPQGDLVALEYFIDNGIVFPTSNENKNPIVIMPTIIKELINKIDTLDYRRSLKVNTELIQIYKGMINVYGVLSLDTIVNLVKKYNDIIYDESYLLNLLKEASKFSEGYICEYNFIISENVEQWENIHTNLDNTKGYKEFSKKELIGFAEELWYINSRFGKTFADNLKEHFDIEDHELNDMMFSLYCDIQHFSEEEILSEIIELIDEPIASNILVREVEKYINNIPIWINKGRTISEMKNKYNSEIKSKITIGRNDPCICGSGKKYKKCCGKEDNIIDLF